MPDTLELSDLDALIDGLDERITETELPEAQATSETCSLLCTIIVCASAVCV
ncbi:hypothetical protein LUX12_20800 [Streptomyces somaliensis]|uniref:Uncharacterized protein n=1 Tax=Streptomyces somaliensis (strain ATCC 33201 / DSM 40738 / JCM 12659 / KCTC 9044 / NCTC 11332 / NRRL B-12077 / IP 733) TaxID=1134445 RepID=A0AA44IFC1_STRE0|nr:hypothetical protein [Streptomyces somaliensis]MCP9946674.1 hypothetical protein [Streptomyces somaliensis]MCP9963412.1 hypothetical protein [Streptomyces somaliensis]MCP9963747.1 hypothetical protein [Streptomyces somaliensis]MCP9972954.1 hypothetical protein [Streptomyces somaliensis]MCQ0021759.1 hypothetical protein [Streptomyces somaliensis DSM 40738]